jgi:hypothetical protein
VPDEVRRLAEELPDPIPPDRLAEVLLIDSYEVLGGSSAERRRYQAELAEAAVTGLVGGDWDPFALVRAAGTAITSRHLQVASTHPEEQEALELLGAAGQLRALDPTHDLLAVTAVNVAGNKADAHVAHRIRHHVALRAPAPDGDAPTITRTVTTRIEVDNGVDLDSDRYISTAQLPRRTSEDRGLDPRPGLVRTWWSLWLPPGARLEHAHDLAGDPAVVRTDELHGLRIVDHLLDTPHGTTSGVEVAATATNPGHGGGRRGGLHPVVRRQPKAVADQLQLVIHAPEGWRIADARLTGSTHGPRATNPLRRRVHLPRLRPSQWVSWRPNGIGLDKPNHYAEMLKTVAENKGQLAYATRILTKGVCDGCALGVAGLHDWTLDGVHLCTTRLNLLQLNTMGRWPTTRSATSRHSASATAASSGTSAGSRTRCCGERASPASPASAGTRR